MTLNQHSRIRRSSVITTSEDYTIDTPWNLVETIYQRHNVTVYRARWRHTEVCVKEIRLDNEELVRSVHREMAVITKCIHPRICQFLGANIMSDTGYLVFEYMHNGDLRNYLKRNPSLEHPQRVEIVMDVALAILYLHERRPNAVLHRDLKPENVLVTRDGIAKVCDFGISRLVNRAAGTERLWGETHTGEVGTYTWMAPEVASSKEYGLAADIYSLGLIIYFVFTNTIPFSQYPRTHAYGIQLLMRKIENKAVLETTLIDDPDVARLCEECTRFDPANRPDAEYVVRRIEAIRDALPNKSV